MDEERWERSNPDGDIPIEEFTLDELEEDEVPEPLRPAPAEETAPEAPAEGYEEYGEAEKELPPAYGEEPEARPWRPDPAIETGGFDTRGRPHLLTRKGKLAHRGWDTADVFEYNKENIRHPFRRKEWEFYQLSNSRFTFQVTYGHAAYAGLAGVTLVDFATGERFTSGKPRFFPGDSLDLDFSGGQPHSLKYEDRDLFLSISFDGEVRRILVRSERFEADLSCHDAGDAIVTVTPFRFAGQFYYNYKKVFRDLAGHLEMHGGSQLLDRETFLLLDSGRGVWPYRHSWIWACGATETDRGVLALNLGGGFGAEGAPTENAVFLDGRIHKLGKVYFQFVPDDCMRTWHISDDRKRLRLTFRPAFDNYTHTNYLLVHNRCHQVYGRLSGTVELDDGEVLRLEDIPFFCEHAVNRW